MMKKLAFVLVLMLSTVFIVQFVPLVMANPRPIPGIEMPYEYIDATIFLDEGVMKAKVNGTYTFHNDRYDYVLMQYPVPPGSEGISVKLGNTSLYWDYGPWNYSTVIGDFPVIWWIIEDTPEDFNVTTYYEHPVPLIDGNYMFLYAMGTGKLLADWPKLTTAYVTIRIGMDIAHPETLNLYTIENSSGTWVWKPANYTITPENGAWKITSTFRSEHFRPLEEDLLLTFMPTTIPTPARACFGRAFPVYPAINISSIGGILVGETLNETFMELEYSMGCEWLLAVTEFLVNESMALEEVNRTALSYLSGWVENVLLGNMTLIDEEVIHGHVTLIYGIHSEDKKNYAWYCNASKILFIVWSEAYCDWTYEIVRAVVESIECHYGISTISNSTITGFNFNESLKQISFNVTGPEGTTGFCNITIPKTLLESLWDNNYTVLIDGSPPLTLSETSNGTHTFLYFTYPHTAHQVTIVPEFPSALILPMLMIFTLVTAIIFASNRRKGKEHT